MLDTIHPQKSFFGCCAVATFMYNYIIGPSFVFCTLFFFFGNFFLFFCFVFLFVCFVFLLYQSFVWEAFWSRLTPQRTVLADSSVSKCCSTFGERQKPSSKSLWNQDSRSCFGQRQDCTLGGKDVSCETQSKSVFRIKISIKILKIQIRTLKSPQKRELKTVTFYLKQKKHLYSNKK